MADLVTQTWYKSVLTIYKVVPVLGLITLFVDAPFGRFSVGTDSKKKSIFTRKLNLDGQLAWIIMELPSPITILSVYLSSPTRAPIGLNPSTVFVALWLAHYANRAVISPLRTPTRSPSHLTVMLSGIGFNLLNGGLNGAWLASPAFKGATFNHTWFWVGLVLFVAGMASNIWHDEVLLNIRRQAKHRYGIPYGGLYSLISYPNYFTEWIEWAGFALAVAAVSGSGFAVTPPVVFVINEVATMLPRAISGHRWYHEKFDDYPKERKAVIPFIL